MCPDYKYGAMENVGCITYADSRLCIENMTIPYYLMASYAYYKDDDPILTDGVYDALAKRILENFMFIAHRHKDLIKLDDLSAGSYLGEYPSIVIGALENLRENFK